MKITSFIGTGILMAALALAGCGGGGGGGTPAGTTISGMASKGPIGGGTVKVFAIRNGSEDKSAPIGQGTTDGGGNFSVNVGAYSGPVEVEVTGGTFTDEATGAPVTLNSSTFLHAVIPDTTAGAVNTMAVTPLTELAYKKAKGTGGFTAANIDDANKSIGANFGLNDIVKTLPVAGGAESEQKNYAFALGVFSQYVHDKAVANEHPEETLARVINTVGDVVQSTGNLSVDAINDLTSAVTSFKNSGKDKSGGSITVKIPAGGLLKISTAGTPGTIGAIDMTINLPAGVTVKTEATGEVATGVVTVSGVAAGANALATANFTAATATAPAKLHVGMVNAIGFGLGECVTIKFDADPATFPPSKNAFTVTGNVFTGLSGSPLTGITIAPASMSVGG